MIYIMPLICKEDSIKECINNGSFKEIKLAFDKSIKVKIIAYNTESKCIDSIIEFTHGSLPNKYSLLIYETHLFLL